MRCPSGNGASCWQTVDLIRQHNIYVVKGNSGKFYKVNLIPTPVFNCKSSPKCYHIMGVLLLNGTDLSEFTKIDSLTELTKQRNNNGVTGLKKSGHKTNSIDRAQITSEEPADMSKYLSKLINSFEEDSVETNAEKISDRFLAA